MKNILIGILAAFSIMSVLWLVQRKTGDAGIVDIGWSLTIPLLGLIYALLSGSSFSMLTIIPLVLTSAWGIRLAWHIHSRAEGKPEDSRYATLREKWGDQTQPKMFLFYQFQAAAAVFFSIPMFLLSQSASPSLGWLEWLGAAIWIVALLGEAAADRQLAFFKKNNAGSGQVCQDGWWNYSRHPNYFFEWLVWVGTSIYVLSSPYGYIALACPALMLFFLFKMTGIPATEEQALKSKGDAYRAYQQTTSVFVPWIKKES